MNTNKLMYKAQVTILAILAVFVMSSIGWAAEYYVDPHGSDISGCGSQANPWKSLSHACGKVTTSGDKIYVNAGTYTDNSQCTLAVGVDIEGAGKSGVTINTTTGVYIAASSNVPTVDGNNDISGIGVYGTDSNTCIYSVGRNNQKIHDCHLEKFGLAIDIRGKSTTWKDDCSSSETETCTYCDNNEMYSVEPSVTDWATGVEIYNNTITNATIHPLTIKNAKIHHNTINNSITNKCGVGGTSLWWSGVEFYDNQIHMKTVAWSVIALEVWMVEDNARFYNNWTNGWFSILKNPHGPNSPYSWQIYNNKFESNLTPGDVRVALETCYLVKNVLIEGNYFANTGAQNTYDKGIGIWGYGVHKNIIIRNNVLYNIDGDGIQIGIDQLKANMTPDYDDIYIYNNLFDNMASGNSGGILICDKSTGDIDGLIVKNNIFTTVSYGVTFWPPPQTISRNEFKYNVVYNGSGFVQSSGAVYFDVSNNDTFNPDLNKSGNKPAPYYYNTNGSNANVVDAGTDVGLPYSGNAPDIGVYEYWGGGTKPAPPTDLTVKLGLPFTPN
jgi:hypothetical protein